MIHKKTFQIALVIIAAVLLIAIYQVMHYLDTPATATIVNTPTATAKAKASTINFSPVSVAGPYADFSYPAALVPTKVQQPSGEVLETYGYEYKALIPWQLTITINNLAHDSVNDDSAYYARIENPAHYNKSTEVVSGNTIAIVTDSTAGGFNKVAFIFQGNRSADIALSSLDIQHSDEEMSVINKVVASWQWK